MPLQLPITENGSTKPFEAAIESEMNNHIKAYEKDLLKIRTGRAHPSMIEDVKVSSYGTLLSLKDVSSISAPDTALTQLDMDTSCF